MNPYGIQQIGVFVPNDAVDVYQLGEKLDADAGFIQSKLGFDRLRRKAAGQECSDLCVKAFEDLSGRTEFDLTSVDCVVVVTQNPDGVGLPHASAVVHHKLGLPAGIACFDISLGCTGYVHGLSVICGFLQQNQMQSGLLFTSDPYSRVIDMNDRDTAMLFGDAASCTLISDKPAFLLGESVFCTGSRFSDAIKICSDDNSLKMHGNQVFRFVAKTVPKQIQECLAKNGLTAGYTDLFLVHQGSRYIVETLAGALDLPAGKMPFDASNVGNTVSTTLPLMLKDYVPPESEVNTVLLSGFGVGLSSAATVIKRSVA